MVRRVLFAFLFVGLFVSYLQSFSSQPRGKVSKSIQKGAKKTIGVQFKLVSIGETTAKILYEADTTNYAIFISTEAKCKRIVKQLDKAIVPEDTLNYPALKTYGEIGKLVSTLLNKQKGEINFEGLASRNDYWLHIFSQRKDSLLYQNSFQFNTIATKPELQAFQISFDDITDTSFVVSWVNGSGEGRIVVVAKGDRVALPENGKDYGSSTIYGKGGLISEKSYVVYDGNDLRPKVKVTGLEPGTKYAVAVFEYNGEGKYRHYNTAVESNNPRVRVTRIPAPRIIEASKVDDGVYRIGWQKSKGGKTYILDVALDKEFKEYVEPYKELDIGDLESYELSELDPQKKYYIRIKAKGEWGESLYSPVFELKTK